MLISVIIPVHNRSALLRSAVDSVVSQTHTDWEAIIVDDGSNDGTAATARELAGRDRRIRVLSQPNRGPAVARETGRREARGEFIQYLDSDDILLPDKFTSQLAAFERAPECDIAYGITRLVDGEGRVLADPLKGTGDQESYLFPRLLRERWWSTHTPLYRRQVCDRVGAWSSQRACEDWEYEARIGATRARLVNCHSPVALTMRHGESRLTDRGLSRETLADITRLMVVLDRCAREAGVPEGAPEWGYFKRWLFLEARRTAACGLGEESDRLLAMLARHRDRDLLSRIRFYKMIKRVAGARLAGGLYDAWSSIRRRGDRGGARSRDPSSLS